MRGSGDFFAWADSLLYLRTDRDAPNRRIITFDVNQPDPAGWQTIVPEQKQSIESVHLIGGRLVLHYLVDVQSRLSLFALDGKPEGTIALPGAGTIAGISGRQKISEIFYSFTSPLYPTTVFSYNPDTGRPAPFEASKPPVDVTHFETKQMFARSKDGTQVPFFLTSRKGIVLNGSHPTMMYGYGGFSISVQPGYHIDVPAWLELGGIWVTMNLRGGAEYGEEWHKAGRLEKKQNVFDDFIAIAEKLIEVETLERDEFEKLLIAHGVTPKKKLDIEHQV